MPVTANSVPGNQSTNLAVSLMQTISYKKIESFRRQTFRLLPRKRVKTKEEAIQFTNQRGFIFFWPIKDIVLPSLWQAVAGDRPVADQHDDPGHVTWGWKDSLLGAHRWYYAKVLRKRATIISLEVLPYFYALSENYGSPEEDYLTIYEQGRLTREAKLVYEALLREGPLDTVTLRRVTHLTSKDSEYRFNRALIELQTDFKILPVGVTEAGAWHYAFAYDLVPRHFPGLLDQTRFIQESQARQKLLELYFKSVGAAQLTDLSKLFRWRPPDLQGTLNGMIQSGFLGSGLEIDGEPGEWLALRVLLESRS
jgi:hypothetical protein